ncbi:RICIN domain-containing protein [Kitasatospora sp. MAP5-34]|uniref:RICIN domain-containing protein n=1 Tax=Kitasatospora sp. MAP5-34 TaxID=3035102 RepID=UPI0024768F10|nr:RICIN domain-containing protein [Kitasatospora sp. MAP5-34]MDH6580269.1 hypothetical protein [Kitasatospora sp. MAP5-34]
MRSAAKTGLRALAVLAFATSAVSATPLVATADTPANHSGTHHIRTFTDKCLDVWGAHTDNGTGIIQYTCAANDAAANQAFNFVAIDGQPDVYEIRTFAGKCLDVWDGRADDGTNLIQYTCTGQANQHFKTVKVDNSPMVEIHTFADKCLDVWDASYNDGIGIIEYTCTHQPNQRFMIG